jgi:phosphatidylserine decarboxylase
MQDPLTNFKTFNQFFIRKLKPEARPLSQEKDAVISPADGGILVFEHIGQTDKLPIKGTQLNLEKLLNNKDLAQLFEGGTAIIVRLAPWDYHRMHFPLAGFPAKAIIIHGKYESVHPLVFTCGIQPLEINERHLILFETPSASTVALIPVGALFVGAIKETYTPEKPVLPGDELGYFTFGGSTIVMLFKAGTITVLPEILHNSGLGKETQIKMGQLIAHVNA